MASVLERYMQGECEQVWEELVALGDQVWAEDSLHADALAVARETMRRARVNIETLIPRLHKLGYQFGYDRLDPYERASLHPPLFAVPGPDVQARLAELERLAEGIPLSIRAWYEVIGDVNFVGIAPFHWPLPPWREGLQQFFEAHPDWMVEQLWRENEATWSGFEAACQEFIATHPQYPEYTFEELRQFAQAHPGFVDQIRSIGTWLDPLQVWSLESQFLHKELTHDHQGAAQDGEPPDRPRYLAIALDTLTKQSISGSGVGYDIIVPCPAADAPLAGEPHKTTFVNYLRLCFRWGGLPGLGDYLNPPREDVAYLTNDLLPI